MAPWANILYACDGEWWDVYIEEAKAKCTGEFWTYDPNAATRYDIKNIYGDTHGIGLGKNGIIHTGGNGGYQAINLAYLLGAKKIILLGFDMQRTEKKSHWHGDHPRNLNRTSDMNGWIKNFCRLALDLRDESIKVINASRETALNCFEKNTIEEALL